MKPAEGEWGGWGDFTAGLRVIYWGSEGEGWKRGAHSPNPGTIVQGPNVIFPNIRELIIHMYVGYEKIKVPIKPPQYT